MKSKKNIKLKEKLDKIAHSKKELFNDCFKDITRDYFYRRYDDFDYLIDNVLTKHSIEWNDICNFYWECNKSDIAIKLLIYLLENDLYYGEYKEKLLLFLPNLKTRCNSFKMQGIFVYDNIKYLEYSTKVRGARYIIIKTDSNIVREILLDMYENNRFRINSGFELLSEFNDSLGEYKVNEIFDFNCNTFWSQYSYFIDKGNRASIKKLCDFYVSLSLHPTIGSYQIFKDNDNLNLNFVSRDDFVDLIENGFELVYYNPLSKIPKQDKWVLNITEDYIPNSSKLKPNTTIKIDFSDIAKPYKELVKEYIWLSSDSRIPTKLDRVYHLKELCNILYNYKISESENLYSIDNNTALLIKKYVELRNCSISTKNGMLNSFRVFVSYFENNPFSFTKVSYEYLLSFSQITENTSKAIDSNSLEELNNLLKNNAHKSYEFALYYAIFHICLQTEFRISQICSLKTDCLIPTLKNNQYEIKTTSKTSNGEEYVTGISNLTAKHLQEIIDISNEIRRECTNETIKRYIFIYFSSQTKQYTIISSSKFTNYISKCCEQLGLEKYTANNLRDTHMTKAYEHCLRNGDSDMKISLLTGHKHIDTTTSHYIETTLIEALEATYGIVIGDVDVCGNILDSYKEDSNENVVENGCGYCNNKECVLDYYITCLKCEHFITSIEHKHFFEETIIYLDDQLKNADTLHDKEDLNNIKKLFVAYLVQIEKKILKKGENNG